jgi:phosphatidylglycerol:prolipoprotein diacylglycerol transferase
MFPVIQIGPFALYAPALALLAGVWAGAWWTEKEAARLGLSTDQVSALVFVSLAVGVVGARLGHVARNLGAYTADPLAILSLSPATFDPAIGLLAGSVAGAIFGLWRGLPPRPTLDALAPGIATLLAAVGIGHLASGDAFGAPADLPWSIFLWDDYRHPSQVYEIIAALSVLGAWRLLCGPRRFDGFSFLLVVGLSAFARVFLEAFRGDSTLVAGGLRAAQVGGLIVLALCFVGAELWGRQQDAADAESLQVDA